MIEPIQVYTKKNFFIKAIATLFGEQTTLTLGQFPVFMINGFMYKDVFYTWDNLAHFKNSFGKKYFLPLLLKIRNKYLDN
jgi:hypothetical protein